MIWLASFLLDVVHPDVVAIYWSAHYTPSFPVGISDAGSHNLDGSVFG